VNWWKINFPYVACYNNYAVIHNPKAFLHNKGTAPQAISGPNAHRVHYPAKILNFHIGFLRRVNT
jgi:hypothetical protein